MKWNRAEPYDPKCVSMRSDKSMDHTLNFRDKDSSTDVRSVSIGSLSAHYEPLHKHQVCCNCNTCGIALLNIFIEFLCILFVNYKLGSLL